MESRETDTMRTSGVLLEIGHNRTWTERATERIE